MQAIPRRAIDGIVLLDKPEGVSSNAALQRVKRLFNAKKAGHTGSLDLPASGLLPICLGEATKITAYLLNADKRYHSRVRLGVRTRTGDAAGEIVERQPVPVLDAPAVAAVLRRFCGAIEQIPPMHSALKRGGQPLYRLAARGITVERPPRTVAVHTLRLIALSGDEIEIDVHCSKGTYIRALAEDLGRALGTCAHVLTLRRYSLGPFDIEAAQTLAQVEERALSSPASLDAILTPMDRALAHLAAVCLPAVAAGHLRCGQAVRLDDTPRAGIVRIYDDREQFLGIGEALADGRIAPRRLINAGA